MGYLCPVCGYGELREAPYNQRGYGSDEICVCCGFQFGCDDFPDKEEAFIKWRNNWIKDGYQWFSKRTKPPVRWNAKEQIKIVR